MTYRGDGVAFDGAVCKRSTDRAILVEHDDFEDPIWFPQSQIHDDSEVWEAGDEGRLVVTKWIAEQKKIV